MLPVSKEFHFVHSENEAKVSVVDVEKRAKRLIQEAVAVQQDGSTSLKTTQCAEGVLKAVKKRAIEVDSSKPEEWEVKAQQIVAQLGDAFKAIDFNPKYEEQIPRTIPVDAAKPMIDLILELQAVYSSIQNKSRNGDRQFWVLVKPWMDKFVFTIKHEALKSRTLQMIGLKQDPKKSKDYELDEVIIQEHINRVVNSEKYPKYYFEVLTSLLNLKNLSERNRKPNMDEQQAFRFLCTIDQKIGQLSKEK
jgi:hypothetical protein